MRETIKGQILVEYILKLTIFIVLAEYLDKLMEFLHGV